MRLRCCVCNADLGSAEDPYRDPDCLDCLRREWEQEARADEEHDRRQLELLKLARDPQPDYPLADLIREMSAVTLDQTEAYWRDQLGVQNRAVLAVSVIERERRERAEQEAAALARHDDMLPDLPF